MNYCCTKKKQKNIETKAIFVFTAYFRDFITSFVYTFKLCYFFGKYKFITIVRQKYSISRLNSERLRSLVKSFYMFLIKIDLTMRLQWIFSLRLVIEHFWRWKKVECSIFCFGGNLSEMHMWINGQQIQHIHLFNKEIQSTRKKINQRVKKPFLSIESF